MHSHSACALLTQCRKSTKPRDIAVIGFGALRASSFFGGFITDVARADVAVMSGFRLLLLSTVVPLLDVRGFFQYEDDGLVRHAYAVPIHHRHVQLSSGIKASWYR